MKAVAYNNEKTLIECKLLQFYSLRGQLLDNEEVTEWNRSKVQLNDNSPVVITLFFFKKKQDIPARKYIKMDESMEHDASI